MLEDRRLPATFSPLAPAADGQPGSLRADVVSGDENLQDNRGMFRVTPADIGGVEALVVQRRLGHHKLATRIFTASDGMAMPGNSS